MHKTRSEASRTENNFSHFTLYYWKKYFIKATKVVVSSYVLILLNYRKREIAVGRLGKLTFPSGYFYYVGSARSGIHRVKRHFAKQKKKRWHIDYISSVMTIVGAVLTHLDECELASRFSRFQQIPHFGCSDCKCTSHLFYSPNLTLEFLST
jgi:Uri superfamily endonuclease